MICLPISTGYVPELSKNRRFRNQRQRLFYFSQRFKHVCPEIQAFTGTARISPALAALGPHPPGEYGNALSRNLRRKAVCHHAVIPNTDQVSGSKSVCVGCMDDNSLPGFQVQNEQTTPLHFNDGGLHNHVIHLQFTYYRICRLEACGNSRHRFVAGGRLGVLLLRSVQLQIAGMRVYRFRWAACLPKTPALPGRGFA